MARDDLQYHSNIQESDTAMKPWHPKHMWRQGPSSTSILQMMLRRSLTFLCRQGWCHFGMSYIGSKSNVKTFNVNKLQQATGHRSSHHPYSHQSRTLSQPSHRGTSSGSSGTHRFCLSSLDLRPSSVEPLCRVYISHVWAKTPDFPIKCYKESAGLPLFQV